MVIDGLGTEGCGDMGYFACLSGSSSASGNSTSVFLWGVTLSPALSSCALDGADPTGSGAANQHISLPGCSEQFKAGLRTLQSKGSLGRTLEEKGRWRLSAGLC